jgi:hypothetical protein
MRKTPPMQVEVSKMMVLIHSIIWNNPMRKKAVSKILASSILPCKSFVLPLQTPIGMFYFIRISASAVLGSTGL